jgi:hypothetical protein
MAGAVEAASSVLVETALARLTGAAEAAGLAEAIGVASGFVSITDEDVEAGGSSDALGVEESRNELGADKIELGSLLDEGVGLSSWASATVVMVRPATAIIVRIDFI